MASVDIPEGDKAVTVKVIDNGARITGPLSFFMDPPVLDNMQSRQIQPSIRPQLCPKIRHLNYNPEMKCLMSWQTELLISIQLRLSSGAISIWTILEILRVFQQPHISWSGQGSMRRCFPHFAVGGFRAIDSKRLKLYEESFQKQQYYQDRQRM
ncbi:hypothetical protein V2G26_007101 [Clonostachys chloroleuca]